MSINNMTPIKILHVNHHEKNGGAARIASTLYKEYRKQGLNSWMVVGIKQSNDPNVFKMPKDPPSNYQKYILKNAAWLEKKNLWLGKRTFGEIISKLTNPGRYWYRYLGREDFNYPQTRNLLKLVPERPDIVHLHNLHEGYFDLEYLSILSREIPTIITLHDAWLLSGHCAHSLDCNRWKTGCGKCPYLYLPPKVNRDATHFNWERKKRIYKNSRLYIASPSKWLLDKVDQSILNEAVVDAKVIRHGIDLNIYHPRDRQSSRAELGLPTDGHVLLFIADKFQRKNYKDYETIKKAIQLLKKQRSLNIYLIAMGSDGRSKITEENVTTLFVPFQDRLDIVAQYYQAADIYLHAANAETVGIVILEAMACGTPVIATAVGGITEQIIDGETGYLVKPKDAIGMAAKITHLLNNQVECQRIGENAAEYAQKHFGVDQMVKSYLDWYANIIKRESPQKTHSA
jgi:glycosyltransferase involved in cell wall biosynthesis